MGLVHLEAVSWAERKFGTEVVGWAGQVYGMGTDAATVYGGYGLIVFAASFPVTTSAAMVAVAAVTVVGATTAAIGAMSFGLRSFGASDEDIDNAADVASAYNPAFLPVTGSALAGGSDFERATTIGANAFKVSAGALSVSKGFADIARGGATQEAAEALIEQAKPFVEKWNAAMQGR